MAEQAATLVGAVRLTPSVLLLEVEPQGPPVIAFRAGQFISLRCDEAGDVRRSYTILSSPSRPGCIELLVKLVPGGAASELLAGLVPGAVLHFTGPLGFFVNDAAHHGDVVHIATGAGIAATLPLVTEALGRERERVTLLWGLLAADTPYLVERLAALPTERLQCERILAPSWPAVHALLAARVTELHPTFAAPTFYLAGNGDMTRTLRTLLVERGIDRRKSIRTEIFYPHEE